MWPNAGTSFSLPMKHVSLGFAEPVASSSSLGIDSKTACKGHLFFLIRFHCVIAKRETTFETAVENVTD